MEPRIDILVFSLPNKRNDNIIKKTFDIEIIIEGLSPKKCFKTKERPLIPPATKLLGDIKRLKARATKKQPKINSINSLTFILCFILVSSFNKICL